MGTELATCASWGSVVIRNPGTKDMLPFPKSKWGSQDTLIDTGSGIGP